jgi:hypothetical protein
MSTPTLQEIFNQVRTHLLKQNAKSMKMVGTSDKMCAYRGDNDRMCSVGCLIKDEEYDKKMESRAVCDCDVFNAVERSLGGVPVQTMSLLEELQNIHDMVEVADWPAAFDRIKKKWNFQ